MNATPPIQFDPVQIAQLFFQRTEIKGSEVEAYVQTYNWLEALKTGEMTALPTAVLTTLRLQTEEQAKVVTTLEKHVAELQTRLAVYEPADVSEGNNEALLLKDERLVQDEDVLDDKPLLGKNVASIEDQLNGVEFMD